MGGCESSVKRDYQKLSSDGRVRPIAHRCLRLSFGMIATAQGEVLLELQSVLQASRPTVRQQRPTARRSDGGPSR